ncbi:MAG: bifunctional folylpolyglutamate synthase/dihydrofolate synthase [Bacteroidales bacterium]|nr:bifunctional folylpolyglutamate synthase/dihydrofolate synthase [Bacteroidales bacterium]
MISVDEKYEKVLKYLFSQLPVFQRVGNQAYKADLERTIALDKHFDHPHKTYKTIHVAGTNGKGSVSHLLASVLQEAGFKTGLYTSPHLKDFRERIKVNGVPVSREYVIRFTEENAALFEKLKPSFFEMTVAMAFAFFQYSKADIAVIETGLGGRLDSTNIILPELSIITNIGHDHSEFLGSDLKTVAWEKAGIIKPGVPVVIGETQDGLSGVFVELAGKNSSSLVFADENYRVKYAMLTMDNKQSLKLGKSGVFGFTEVQTSLLGLYQAKNICTTLQAIDILRNSGLYIPDDSVLKGVENVVENTGLYGRWQILGVDPLVVCDTAHNREGLEEVVKQIRNTAFKTLHFVLGLVKEKQLDLILDLLPKEAVYYFVKANIPRALDAETLAKEAGKKGLEGTVFPDVITAFSEARRKAAPEDMVFVGGSTFVVAEIL